MQHRTALEGAVTAESSLARPAPESKSPPKAPAPRKTHRLEQPSDAHHGSGLNEAFRHFAHRVSHIAGRPAAFFTALVLLVVWGATGPIFGFSDTWQLVINTGTTIITFLMVFLIQSTQNRDASAIHLKLDELIRATRAARNDLVALELMSDDELKALEQQFEALRMKARRLRTQSDDVAEESERP
jgi:low affinity Fe/Cu permease